MAIVWRYGQWNRPNHSRKRNRTIAMGKQGVTPGGFPPQRVAELSFINREQ